MLRFLAALWALLTALRHHPLERDPAEHVDPAHPDAAPTWPAKPSGRPARPQPTTLTDG